MMTKTPESEKWNDQEIKKVAKIFIKAEKNKSLLVKALDELVHWLLILLILFGNLIIDLFMVLLSGLLSAAFFYGTVILVALLFGILVEIVLLDIQKLDKQKHSLSRISFVILALVNVIILFGIKNTVEFFTKIEFRFNAFLAGLIYGLFFIAPHFINSFRKK